jgi:hypothetical protein
MTRGRRRQRNRAGRAIGREARSEQLRVRPRADERRRFGHRGDSEPALSRQRMRENARRHRCQRFAWKKNQVESENLGGRAKARFAAFVGQTEQAPDGLDFGAIGKRAPHEFDDRLARASLAATDPDGDHSTHGFSTIH